MKTTNLQIGYTNLYIGLLSLATLALYGSSKEILIGFEMATERVTPNVGPTLHQRPGCLHITDEKSIVVLNSHGFNAQKPSNFSLGGIDETVSRGLTIIHFNFSDAYEFRTFDTYSSEEEAAQFMETLEKFRKSSALYAILAHDSASKELLPYAARLRELGFEMLSKLESRQAYIMHNLLGKVQEKMDALSLSESVIIPASVKHTEVYFPKVTWNFEPNIDRYIAHGGGEVNGISSTNSLEALNESYNKGFRLFELDIIETSDGHYVASHDWKMWSRFTNYQGELPVSLARFTDSRIYDKYTPLTMEAINAWFAEHRDATLITDKVNDPVRFGNQFIDRSRLIMELFSFMAIEEAGNHNIRAMISQEPLEAIAGEKLSYLNANGIKYVALSRRMVAGRKALLEQLRDNGIRVYVYNVGFDPGKDESYVQENEIGLVYGMYADKWIFDSQKSNRNPDISDLQTPGKL